ncbi:MAG: 7-carboxy-7-deazaguanine synthase QueE [Gammaproteobacteria bacterium]|nr:7-carboxy-7-deazaguanine synthase QueE [Gammaproteobacteria bacterium]MBU4003387.1 7-carboxy-7-deazaguanine synthase QueE [Gammaproteobacteria bacterium]MBU4021858.1 7-carboxy-7-deazaguanine synthase QueE [Gammaproteobacteria bacterium]MBU4097233.1 7-carboxy-7-deazaguanine synthase QueE [Gammaproteobacteria bacterium]MBU4145333.1 7-carboxy-7-deazaguanine synthase QueE [Gammaproteobacteria bacterium]
MVRSDASVSLRVSEVFYSLQGESTRVGLPTVFIRLTGCPLRCTWCDTTYAFSGGEHLTLSVILDRVASFACTTVCVTGGEPLAQPNCLPLLSALCDEGFSVSLETSGALDIGSVDPRVARIVDLKAPDSGESEKNRWENIDLLLPTDEIKIVLASRADFDWAVAASLQHQLFSRCPVLFSPVWDTLPPAQLAEWIIDNRLPVRFQLQMHKHLWGNERSR